MTNIPDAVVERAARALHEHDTRMFRCASWERVHPEDEAEFRSAARAALEAAGVAGLVEALERIEGGFDNLDGNHELRCAEGIAGQALSSFREQG